jgi:hypothetical protein
MPTAYLKQREKLQTRSLITPLLFDGSQSQV